MINISKKNGALLMLKNSKHAKFTLFFMLLVALVTLSACSTKQGAKDQLLENSKTVLKDIKAQKKNLNVIKNQMEASQARFPKEQKKYPKQNLLNVTTSKTYQAVTKRKDAFTSFKDTQNDLKMDQTTLTKISNQDLPDMPKELMNSLIQSLHLSALDQRTFANFLTEMTQNEATYYNLLSNPDTSTSATELDAQENRLNQYYGAVYQQIEIMNVNLNTAQKQAQRLQKSVASGS